MSKPELMRKIGIKFGEGQRLSTSFAMISMRKVLAEDDDGWDVEAEVFGSGVEMWMRSQGDYLYKFERV